MATLTSKQLKDSYQGLLTIKTADDANPLSGRLENGLGNAITALGIGTDSPFFTTSGRASLSLNGTSSSLIAFGKNGSSENYFLADAGGFTIANTSATLPTTFYNNGLNRAQIKSSGDISFRDTSSNEAFYWDASTARLGLGTQTPDYKLQINGSGTVARFTDGTSHMDFYSGSGLNEIATVSPLLLSVGGTERLRIDSSGDIQFAGANSNTTVLSLNTTSGSDTKQLSLAGGGADSDGRGARFRLYGNNHASLAGDADLSTGNVSGAQMDIRAKDKITLHTNSNPSVTIDSSGNVGIGGTPASISSTARWLTLNADSGSSASGGIIHQIDGTTKGAQYVFGSNVYHDAKSGIGHQFAVNNGSNAMTIDTSGNVLVGTTDTAPGVADTNVGVALNSGRVFASAEADYALNLNRNTSDGDVIRIRKDGTTVGQIGLIAGLLTLGSNNNVALTFTSSSIRPSNNDGSGRDNAIDLGQSGNRFNDLYLGGSVYLGGTTSANALDDYEEGTWSPTYTTNGTDFTSITYDTGFTGGKYTKIGDLVHIQGTIRTDAITVGSASGTIEIAGLPFAIGSSTNGRDGFITINVGVATAFGGDHPVTMYGGANNSRIVPMTRNTANGATDNLQVSDLDTGADKNLIYFSGTYKS